jgi:predicted Zn-dependent protease with MMP-like domain
LAARSPSPSAANQQRSHAATRQHAEDTAEPPSQDGAEPPDFERLVDEAVAAIPDEFQPYLRNVAVRVRPEPTAAERRRMRLRERETLFGLYEGVMLTNQGAAGAGPEIITIFQRPIERACEGDPARMREQVRRTVLHELAHHFGLDHDEMPDWIK